MKFAVLSSAFLLASSLVFAKPTAVLQLTQVRRYGSAQSGVLGMKGFARNPGKKPLDNDIAVIVQTDAKGKVRDKKGVLAFRALTPGQKRWFDVKAQLEKNERHDRILFGFGLASGKPLTVMGLNATKRGSVR